MPANIATYFILAGGLAGIAMGLFGLAPLVFQRRLGRRSEAQRLQEERIYAREMAMAADEASRATAWGVLVGSRRTSHGPAGIDRPQPFEPAVPISPAEPEADAYGYPEWLEPVTEIPNPLPDATNLLPPSDQPTFTPLAELQRAKKELPDWMTPEPVPVTPEVEEGVLALFREVMPAKATAATRARDAADHFEESVSIEDLLTEARWMLRGLKPNEAA